MTFSLVLAYSSLKLSTDRPHKIILCDKVETACTKIKFWSLFLINQNH